MEDGGYLKLRRMAFKKSTDDLDSVDKLWHRFTKWMKNWHFQELKLC